MLLDPGALPGLEVLGTVVNCPNRATDLHDTLIEPFLGIRHDSETKPCKCSRRFHPTPTNCTGHTDQPMAKSVDINPRVGGSNPPLGTIPISFQFIINDLLQVGQWWILWWDSHSFRARSHFCVALAASFFWRAPLV